MDDFRRAIAPSARNVRAPIPQRIAVPDGPTGRLPGPEIDGKVWFGNCWGGWWRAK